MVPSALSLVHTSVPKGIIVTARCCPPRATLWDPGAGVSAMVCVPKNLCELPPCSALHHSPQRLFTCKQPALLKVQLSQARRQNTRLGSRTSELVPSSPTAPSKLFHCFMPVSPCKAEWYLLCFDTNHWIYGSKLLHKSSSFLLLVVVVFGHQWNDVSAASHLHHSHLANSRKLNTLQKLTIPRSLHNAHKEFGTTKTITSLHITGMLFVSKGIIC